MKKEKKLPHGRPTKYKPEYDQLLIDHMAKGYSFESFAGDIDVNQDTLHEWCKVHPSFSEAKKNGRAKSMKLWESWGIEGLWSTTETEGRSTISKSMNSSMWIFNMKNRFGWRDKLEVTETDPDENKLEEDFE